MNRYDDQHDYFSLSFDKWDNKNENRMKKKPKMKVQNKQRKQKVYTIDLVTKQVKTEFIPDSDQSDDEYSNTFNYFFIVDQGHEVMRNEKLSVIN